MLSDRLIEAALRSAAHPGPATALPHERLADGPRGPCVAISREVGARGTTVARLVGAKLDWPVYDRELVELVARDMNVRATYLTEVDEKPSSWLEECCRALGGISRISESAYCHRLVKVLWSLAERGQCVIVGRGAAQVLPASTTLRVRLIGAVDDRIAFIARQRGLSREIAARQVAAIDRARVAFVRDHFHKDPMDASQYDLVLNSSRIPVQRCAKLIVQTLGALAIETGAKPRVSAFAVPVGGRS
jgi:cytidylate kinase